jgi:hypothetical protein
LIRGRAYYVRSGVCPWTTPRSVFVRYGSAGQVAAAGRGGGHAGSGPRFHPEELETLNQIVEHHLPLGPEDWELATNLHTDLYPDNNGNSANLRRKEDRQQARRHKTRRLDRQIAC